ncbi:MAG TPA: DUF6220 domain-containing protein [Gaiellaceae bacterium]
MIAAAVAVQFFLAGAGAFGATSFAPHRTLGWAILFAAAVELLVAFAAVRFVRRSAILFLLVALQAALGVLGADTQAWFGALHGLNALGVMAAAGILARAAWLTSFTGRRPGRGSVKKV